MRLPWRSRRREPAGYPELAPAAERRVQDHRCPYREVLEGLIARMSEQGDLPVSPRTVLRLIGAEDFARPQPGTDPLTGCAPVTAPGDSTPP